MIWSITVGRMRLRVGSRGDRESEKVKIKLLCENVGV